MDYKPCPFCGSTTVSLKTEGKNFQIVCGGACGAQGPVHQDQRTAEIYWNDRRQESFLKTVVAWMGSVHAANANEYEGKSISKSRRNRQIGILKKVAAALLDGRDPNEFHHGTPEEQMKAAGERAFNYAKRLENIQ